MVIFHSYVKLPEGIYYMFPTSSNDFQNDVMLSELHGAQSSEATARSLRPAETSSPFGRVKTAKSPRMFSIFYGYLWVCFPSLSIYIYIYIYTYIFFKKNMCFFSSFFAPHGWYVPVMDVSEVMEVAPKIIQRAWGSPCTARIPRRADSEEWIWVDDDGDFPQGHKKMWKTPWSPCEKTQKTVDFQGFSTSIISLC